MKRVDETHDPSLKSWIESANGHGEFPIQNLPFGVFSNSGSLPRAGVAIGDLILDLAAASEAGLLPPPAAQVLDQGRLNGLLALPPAGRRELRQRLSVLLADERHRRSVEPLLHVATGCTLHLPAEIGDYTDFYAGIEHATNVGKQFRPDNPLLPNYKYIPIGYHGRASSIRPSGVPVIRPNGQRKAPNEDAPTFGPSRRLDYELELGAWIGGGNELGEPIAIDKASDHLAGVCLLNDWSARDIQSWEYQPLGPFLAKSFHSTISPWIVTTEALAPFWVAQPPRPWGDPPPLAYLLDEGDQRSGALAVSLEAHLITKRMLAQGLPPHRLSLASATNMYWTIAQLIAHHTSNGCNLRAGDLLGTGTISAPTEEGFGSLLEISHGGSHPVQLPSGETRTFLEDGDEVILSATAQVPGFVPIGLGHCRAVVLPAHTIFGQAPASADN